MRKYLLVLACIALCAGGCNYKRGSTQLQEILDTAESLGVDKARFLYNAGFDDYNCGDYDPLVIKHYFPTSGKNRVVLGLSDPYSYRYGNKYVGLDLTGYDQLIKDIEGLEDDDKVQALQDFVENAYVSDLSLVGDFFYQKESGELFSEKGQVSKDLESMGAHIQLSNSKELANRLSSEYGLSQTRAGKVAKLISQYQSLSSKRSLSNSEQNYFSRELLGVDYNEALQAMTKNQDEQNELLEKAAEVNGTSSEQVSSIIQEMFL